MVKASAHQADDNTNSNAHGVSGLIRSLSNEAHIFIFSYSPVLKCLMSWTDNLKDVLGVQAVSVARDANLFLRYVHPDDKFQTLTAFEEALQGKSTYQVSYRWNRPDTDQTRWLHCRAALVETDEGPLFEGCIVDLTDEMRNTRSPADSPDSVQSLIDALPYSTITLDRDLRILRTQESFPAEFHFGDEQFLAHKVEAGIQFPDCFLNQSRRVHYSQTFAKILDGTLKNHSERHTIGNACFELQILPIRAQDQTQGILLLVLDVGEKITLENRLAKLERSEAVKQLAMGLAHNVNNVFQSVLGHALAIRENQQNPQVIEHSAQKIIELVTRSSSLTGQLFELDSRGEDAKNTVDLNLAAMTAVNKIEDVFSSGLKIAVAFGSPPNILIERPVLERLLERLLRTLYELRDDKSDITITTYQVVLSDNEVPNLSGGLYAKLIIAESVHGEEAPGQSALKPDDPAYKTFLPGLNLVQELGGALQIERFSRGELCLSLYFRAQHSLRAHSSEGSETNAAASSRPEIMIIDDDLMVLDTVQRLLVDAGYNCLAAEDGRKALSLVRKHKDSIRLILLDALMPGMNGARLLKKLKDIQSDFQVIGFSGAPPEVTRSLLEGGAVRILRKPVDPTQLKATIAELYQRSQAAA